METPALSVIRFGLDATLKVTLILALVVCVVAALRRSSAALRHAAAVLGLTGALALPLAGLFVPQVHLAAVPSLLPPAAIPARSVREWPEPASGSGFTLATPERAGAEDAGAASPALRFETLRVSSTAAWTRPTDQDANPVAGTRALGLPRSRLAGAAATPYAWAPWALALWAAGALLSCLRLLFGTLRVRAIARGAEPMRDPEWLAAAADISRRLSLRSPVRILTSPEVPIAMTAGARRPVLLLHASASRWPADRRRVVLFHELAHVRRRDWITLLLCELAVAVYWFHPLVWLARHEARLNGERACDDLVIGDGTKPSVYAAHLLGIVRSFAPGARTALPVMSMARPSQFEGRMRAILDPGLQRRGPSRGQVRAAALGLFSAVLVLAALAPCPWSAQAAALPGGLAFNEGPEQVSWPVATKKSAAAREKVCRFSDRDRCRKKEAAAPAAVVATEPPVGDSSGFVQALARFPEIPQPEPQPETRPQTAAAPLPAGIVLAGDRHERSGEDWYDRGMSLHRSGRYAEAIVAFGNAIERGYREDAASYNTACSYALKGDKDHAFEWLRKAADAGFSLSSYIGDDDDLDSLRSDPRFATLRSWLREHRSTKELDEARRAKTHYERLLGRSKNSPDAYFAAGRELLGSDEFALSAKAFQRSAELGYRPGTSLYNAACALSLGGEKAAALDSLQKALENGFDDPSLFRKDDDLAAVRGEPRFRELEALADDLEMPSVKFSSRIFRSSERREWREAAEHSREVAGRHPSLGRAWFNLGYAEIRGDRPEAAAEAFQKAIELNYRKPTTLYNLACSYAKAGQKDRAFDYLFQALNAGFDERSTLRSDEDLDNLRSDPRFRNAERIAKAHSDSEDD